MACRTVKVTIEGVSSLLMHKFSEVSERELKKMTPEEQAEKAAYRDDSGVLFIPAINVYRGLIAAAAFSRKGDRWTRLRREAHGFVVKPEQISLGTKEYIMDAAPLPTKGYRGNKKRYRPRLDTWACEFEIEWNDEQLTEAQVRKIVDNFGSCVGLMDFRPEKNGLLGKFKVTSWEVVQDVARSGAG